MTIFSTVVCAYCGHTRKLPIFKMNEEEHTWCIKCCKTSKFNFGTNLASKIEDIKLKGQHDKH